MLDTIAIDIVNRLEDLSDMATHWFNEHLVNIVAILICAWIIRHTSTWLLIRLIKHTVRPDVYPTKADREKRIQTLHNLASGIIRLLVYVITTIMVIGEINQRFTTLLFASAGLIGVAFGFGAQSLIRDLASGIFIIIENQYRIGDEVTLMAGNGSVEGIVEDLTIRTTVLRDLSGNVHHVPNGNIVITSNKTLGYSRMNENIKVALNTDIDKLEGIVTHVGRSMAADTSLQSKLLEAPYLASVKGFTEDGVIVRISAKTSPAAQWKIRSEFYKRLKSELKDHKIKLAGETAASDTED